MAPSQIELEAKMAPLRGANQAQGQRHIAALETLAAWAACIGNMGCIGIMGYMGRVGRIGSNS